MRTYEEAVAGDYFFLCAFMLTDWIHNLIAETILAYHTADSCPSAFLQDGQAFDGFCQIFDQLTDDQFHFSLHDMFRFTRYDTRYATTLARALVPLAIEERLTGRPLVLQRGQSPRLLRRTARFWCDWLDATIQLEVHRAFWWTYTGPGSAHVEDIAIAAFGHPMCRHPSVAQVQRRRRRPRKPAHTAKTADTWDRLDHPPFPGDEIETVLIALQPLARRYQWTAGDVFDVMVPIVHRAEPHFCWSIYDLENYRRDNLGLPDLESCDRQLPAPPAGLALAANICPPVLSGVTS
ncbi:MAG TPA: hypothetical protein VN578_14645 [Candidatus Binatia bacterium]|nr:hypothetical protein [Candidatus Binatia bacterium]